MDGGRFGRALRVDKPDMAVIPFNLTKMPEEGTIECWLSPDSAPQLVDGKGDLFIDVRSSGQSLGNFGAGTDVTLHWVWRISGEGKQNYLGTSGTISLQRMRKGQWAHLAVTWDPAAWRIYVDGVLAGMLTKPPLGWCDAPVNITIGSEHGHACWSGMIDEIRVSKVKRFGPFIPKGSTPVPLPVPEMEPQTAKTPEVPAKPAVDLAAERKKMIGCVPLTRGGEFEAVTTPDGDYVYEATSAKPLIDGGELTIDKDWHVKGLTSLYAPGTRTKTGLADYGGAYWTLGGVKPGLFWIGLLYESQEGDREAPSWAPSMYLNGRVIQCSTLGDPVQIAPGIWLAELQSAAAEPLKPGDDIAVTSVDRRKSRFVRLLLHPKEPARGAFRTAMNFGGNWGAPYSTLGVSAETRFVGKDGKDVAFMVPLIRLDFQTVGAGRGTPIASPAIAIQDSATPPILCSDIFYRFPDFDLTSKKQSFRSAGSGQSASA